jgi:indole-3-glycerol phosphate synthase
VDVLAEIIADTRRRLEQRKPNSDLRLPSPDFPGPGRFHAALARPGISVIAEHKRRSPSAGVIREDLTLEQVVQAYERGGAAAISVLTEESRFGGSLHDLATAVHTTELPVLRKEFIIDPFQIHEAVGAGAAAVLLIVAAFPHDTGTLGELQREAAAFGLDVLMEVHNAAELEVALGLNAPIIGINNRNLSTLQVDLATTYGLLPRIPAGTLTVAESGFRTAVELARLQEAGVDAVLIGEALMRSPDLDAACRELTDVALTRR